MIIDLKNGDSILTEKYFDELLERIKEIRISERKFYQKILSKFEKYRIIQDRIFVSDFDRFIELEEEMEGMI